MSGLNHGNRYTFGGKAKASQITEEGVYFSEHSKKFVVKVKNTSRHGSGSPFISIFQHENEDVAKEFFKTHKQKSNNK